MGGIIGMLIVIAWVLNTRTSWADVGLTRWPQWKRELGLAVLGGVLLKVVLKAIVLPPLGVPPTNAAYRYLTGNTAALPGMLALVLVSAGLGEELFWRGFLFERLRALLGASPAARGAIVAITAVLFGFAHLPDQGWPGVLQSTITGATFGTAFSVLGRLWPVVVAHAAFDVAAVFMIYTNTEASFAHLMWR